MNGNYYMENAKWISYDRGNYTKVTDKHGNPSPVFRKTFFIRNEVKRVRVYAGALGVFKAYLNGKEIDNDILMPGWTPYQKYINLIEYDITNRCGKENCLAFVLGDGWYIGTVGASIKRMTYGQNRAIKIKVSIEYSDGSIDEIFSDENWKASTGKILYSDIFYGEYIDNRLSLGDFSCVEYSDKEWNKPDILELPKINLTPFDDLPVRVLRDEAFKPISVTKSKKKNTFIYDLGQNFAGIVGVTVKGSQGARLTLRHGEVLSPDKELYVENLRTAAAQDCFVLAGDKVEYFEPLFTYHGFRYVEVTVTDGLAEVIELIGLPITTKLTESGSFSCSSSIVNKLYSNAVWGQKSNFVSIPTDCPQRDERLGWTGDAQIFCRSALYNTDAKKFYESFLRMVRAEQWDDGTITMFAPTINGSREAQVRASGWGDAICIIPTDLYQMYGDIDIIKDNIDSAKAWVRCCAKHTDGFIKHEEGEFGDWLSIGEVTDISVVATLFFAQSARLTAFMCRTLNDRDESEFLILYESIKKAFCEKLIGDDGRILSDTQSCYVLAYAFGIIDKYTAVNNLVRKINEFSYITCGFLGIKYILPVLCELGETTLAYELITKTSFPSWGNCALNGATTIWERWNSYTSEDGFFSPAMNSLNHYSLGSFNEWLFSHVLGINISADGEGGITLSVCPFIDVSGQIKHAKGHYDSVKGRVTAEWKNVGGKILFEISVPDDLEFTCAFPNFDIVLKEHKGKTYCYTLESVNVQSAMAK